MCAIGGIIGDNWETTQLISMLKVQDHRGPDDNNTFIAPNGQCGLIHNRLKIIDLSSSGKQPMCNSDESLWIVFNGEIYNFIELKSELSDYQYKNKTDTEVILAAYEKWGEKCVDHFIGMFAFAIWEPAKNKLFCARDRLGIKPFYYAIHDECFIFSSEIKGILASGHPAKPDIETLSQYLIDGYYDHTNNSFFHNIKSLGAGKTLIYKNKHLIENTYWSLVEQPKYDDNLETKDSIEYLQHLIKESVRLRLRSDVPLGVNLSGGIDSASLAATMESLLPLGQELNAFTASYTEHKYDELRYASDALKDTNISLHTSRLNATEVPDLIEKCMWHQEGPFGGISTLSYMKLHELAKNKDVTVLLEGQGVDELFAGYNYFYPPYLADLITQNKSNELRSELNSNHTNINAMLAQSKIIIEGGIVNTYQDGTNHLKEECISPQLKNSYTNIKSFPTPFNSHLNNFLYRDLIHTKLPRVLRFNDRLAMAYSRELREPFLDHRLVEFAFRLPGNTKIHKGKHKFIFRKSMESLLPESVVNTSKRPVVTPQREWMKSYLKPFVEEIIHSQEFKHRGLFDVKKVHRTFEQFCRGEGSNSFFIWQWINTEIWFRTFIDNKNS